jgi:alkylation response protein AidB-like acyl-CoA dehydrogenase
MTIMQVIEELSRADGSAGWTIFIGNTTAFVAWLQPEVAKEMLSANPDFTASGVFAPNGLARPDEHGETYTIDGQWPFNSGCPHADWFMQGVVVMDGDAPQMIGPRPNWRFAFFPSNEGEIIDTWHVSGLRGTGSHDVVAKGVRVPVERTIMPFLEPARFDGLLYRLPFHTMLCSFMSGFPLGVARRAIDEFAELAAKKSRRVPPGPSMAEDETVQVEVARSEAAVRSARAFVIEALGQAWDTVCAGNELTIAQRAMVKLAALNAARTARATVGQIFGLAGGGALYDNSPLQRCARDVVAGTQHIIFSLDQWKVSGRVFLNQDPETFMI